MTADVDWVTGAIRWFVTAAEFQEFRAALTSEKDFDESHRDIAEDVLHETEHLLQITTTGFAYDLSRRLYEIVFEACKLHPLLAQLYRHRAEYTERLRDVFDALDRQGQDGITPRGLLESLAFLRQKRLSAENLTHAEFRRMLDTEVEDRLYRDAYDVATLYLGDDAILHFAHIANLALYTKQPERVFVPLLQTFAEHASRLSHAANHQLGTNLLGERFPSLILGTAASQARAGHRHPLLRSTVNRIEAWIRTGATDNRFFILFAGAAPAEVTALTDTTMFFPPDEHGMTPIFPSANDPTIVTEGKNTSFLRFLCAASRLLQEGIPTPDVPVGPALSLEPGPSDAAEIPPLAVRTFAFTRESVTQPERLAEWVGLLTEMSADPVKARAFRDTCFLSFGDLDEDWTPSPGDPLVGVFVRALFERVPHLLYFLHAGEGGQLRLVFEAFTPEDRVRLPDGALGFRLGERTVPMLTSLFRAAAEFAERLGQPRSVVLGHLATLPPQVAKEVRDAVW